MNRNELLLNKCSLSRTFGTLLVDASIQHCGTTKKYLDFTPEADKLSLYYTEEKFQVKIKKYRLVNWNGGSFQQNVQQLNQMELHIQKYAEHIQNVVLQNSTGLSVIKKFHKKSRHRYEYFHSKVHPCSG